MSYTDRYAGAVKSSNLRSKDSSPTTSDADVLGAAGLAAKNKPLAMALLRLFVGGEKEVGHVVVMLADMVQHKAKSAGLKCRGDIESREVASAVLAWFRFGTCPACSGRGYQLVAGKPGAGRAVLSDAACTTCKGTAKRPFDSEFKTPDKRLLARWLLAEIEREQADAGPAAMAKLAPKLDL